MIFGLLFMALFAALLFFAAIGIKVTVEKHQDSHALDFVRDILKYIALFLAVFFTSFGLSGLLAQAIDPNDVVYFSKEDTARWLSFVVVGIPVVVAISRWVKRSFTKNLEESFQPAWQLYLLFATTFSFAIWFLFLTGSLTVLAGEQYNPKGIASGLIAFIFWLIHLKLISLHRSLLINLHRFIGWFAGITGGVVAAISLLDVAISKVGGIDTGRFQVQEAIITLAISAPTAIFYWQNFESNATPLEARVYRTFAGQAIPALFATIAATFTVNTVITWATGGDAYWHDVPSTTATALLLAVVIAYFKKLVAGYERDDITRVFQYLISGMAMFGIAIATGALVAGLLDTTDNNDAIIFGVSLLITTLPTWFITWRKCQFALAIEFEAEHHAPVRRFYLYAMIGVPTIVAIGASVFVVFTFFKALLIGGLDRIQLSTPLGILISTALVALYHLRIQRKEAE